MGYGFVSGLVSPGLTIFLLCFFAILFRWGILLMYKKFLVSMLLTAALVGCNHQPSDKQGDQSDAAMPVQDQMANPANSTGSDQQIPVNPSAVEPTQTPPSDTTPATPATPDTSSNGTTDATPAEPANNDNSANSAAGAH
ncbi:MAG: hypothetical protein RJA83_1444 [Pseudomonadota bacterium]